MDEEMFVVAEALDTDKDFKVGERVILKHSDWDKLDEDNKGKFILRFDEKRGTFYKIHLRYLGKIKDLEEYWEAYAS